MSKADILRLADYLEHIYEAIQRIERYTDDMDEVAFLEDERTQDAVIRNFKKIGEAARNIQRYHKAFALSHSDVPWAIAYEMRNALAHGYFQVDLEIVWKTIQNDLPGLKFQINKLRSLNT